ncbi:MAG: type VI secretion lipoprotein TssJ [Deltaproteobacteria bacterium]|nr:type VI secretion lipoprotein TssJ [Deltaproteobacteria bacterium]
MSEQRKGQIVTSAFGRLLLISSILAAIACANDALKPRETCLTIKARASLNLYDGEAHALNLLLFPLAGATTFQETTVDDLLKNERIEGATGRPISLMVRPSEKREFREMLPPGTQFVGLVADFYQAGLDSPGNRRALVPARCKRFGTVKIVLTGRDLVVD